MALFGTLCQDGRGGDAPALHPKGVPIHAQGRCLVLSQGGAMATSQKSPATNRDSDSEPYAESPGSAPELVDDRGPIPTFPPLALDEQGRLITPSPEERAARHDAAIRALAALDQLPDDDPPDTEIEMMRGIDALRSPGRKLFEG